MALNDSDVARALVGQVAMVTGGGRGIGRAVAERLAAIGASVAVIARTHHEVEEVAAAIEADGGRALAVSADVTDSQAVQRVTAEVEQQLGAIDLLVNNAGVITPLGPAWEVDPAEWWRCMEVNVYGAYLCTAAVLPSMVRRRRGRIVNMASGAGLQAIPFGSAYVVSKTALIRLAETLAAETKEYGISVFAIHPGTVETAMTHYLAESESGKSWTPWFRRRYVEEGTYDSMEAALELVTLLASGEVDVLSGGCFGVSDNVHELAHRAAEIQQNGLYTLRLRVAEDS